MNSLLDYGSSSSSDTEEDETVDDEKQNKDESKPKLPKPTLGENSLQTSVFSNPFAQAELAKAAILEKHVKMIPGKDNMQMINGRKICWNYRKGRCRFGHNCKYGHDSDILKTDEELKAEKQMDGGRYLQNSYMDMDGIDLVYIGIDVELSSRTQKLKTVVCEGAGTMSSAPPPQVVIESTDDDVWEGGASKKKKRPGLTSGLVPGKKVIKMYKEQKLKDAIKK